MRKNAVVRIIIFTLLILILSGILVAGIGQFGWEDFSIHIGGTTAGGLSGGVEACEKSFDATQINEIVILWVSGQVTVSGGDTDSISYETRNNNTEFETVYKLENGRLSIGFNGKKWNTGKVRSKDLTVTLPQNWEGKLLKIEAVSADLTVEKLSDIEQLNIENVSGKNTVQSVVATQLDAETVSGDLNISGEFETIDIEGVSAHCTIDASAVCPKSIDMDTVSGDLTLYLPEGYGFDLNLDGVSKTLNTSLPYEKDGSHYLSEGKLGICQIDMDSVSGNISVSVGKIDQKSCPHLWDGGQLLTVPGDNRQEMVYTCLLCSATKSETISASKLFTVTCADSDTEERLIEPLRGAYPSGYEVRIVTNIIMDADLHLYINGEFACTYTPERINDTQYWVFSFIMPEENVTIELKVVGGM